MPASEIIKILVVDDLPEKALVYRSILEETGLEVVTVTSGAEALKRLLNDDEFAVVLLDVNMPVMDGFETASLIRSRRKCAHTPIIFVTAHADDLHSLRGYSYGAVDYILAPIAPEILRTKVRVFVELQRQNARAREQAAHRIATAEREQAFLADMVDRVTDFAARIDGEFNVIRVNRGGQAMLGYAPGEAMPAPIGAYYPAWALEVMRDQGLPTARSKGVWFGESALRTRAGAEIPVSQVILAQTTAGGEIECYSIVARDITAKREVESELARHRTHLEELVRERTLALEESHERLRLTDRLASIGTLAAGLGHDMGNLLLPIRMRLDVLERTPLPDSARADLRAIAESCEYLKRLSRGLRNFALNPENEAGSGDPTRLALWWSEVSPFLQNALPRGVSLDAGIPDDLPPITIAPHVLTQAIYNVIQNAADALKPRGTGAVKMKASRADAGRILVEISDDGPGMTPEVLRRCMEPLFTTKTRTLSTGLGLALIRGAIQNAGGTIEIQSPVGIGTTVRITIPVAAEKDAPGQKALHGRGHVRVRLRNHQMGAVVRRVLRSWNFDVIDTEENDAEDPDVLIADLASERESDIVEFLRRDPTHRAIVISSGLPPELLGRVTLIAPETPASQLRPLLESALVLAPQAQGSP